MKAIKDSVHGHVRLGDVAAELVDTPAFQRLRHIKQLSTVRLVYPSANHTRFEHSLGVYHLAGRAVEGLGVDDDTAAHVRAAAMLHDVGHGPYGHQTEGIIRRATGRDHDDVGWLLTDADREVRLSLDSIEESLSAMRSSQNDMRPDRLEEVRAKIDRLSDDATGQTSTELDRLREQILEFERDVS